MKILKKLVILSAVAVIGQVDGAATAVEGGIRRLGPQGQNFAEAITKIRNVDSVAGRIAREEAAEIMGMEGKDQRYIPFAELHKGGKVMLEQAAAEAATLAAQERSVAGRLLRAKEQAGDYLQGLKGKVAGMLDNQMSQDPQSRLGLEGRIAREEAAEIMGMEGKDQRYIPFAELHKGGKVMLEQAAAAEAAAAAAAAAAERGAVAGGLAAGASALATEFFPVNLANQAVVGVVDQEDPDNSELGQLGIAAGDAYAQAVQAQEDYENIKHAGYADTSDIQALRAVARNKAMEAEFALQMLQNQAAQMPEYALAVDEKGNNLVSMDSDAAGERGNAIYNAQGSRRQRLSDITNNAVYGVSRQFGRGSDFSDLGQDVRRAKKSIMSAPRNAYDFTRQRLSNGTSWVSQVPTRVKDGATSAWEKFTSLFARNKQQAAQ